MSKYILKSLKIHENQKTLLIIYFFLKIIKIDTNILFQTVSAIFTETILK